MTQMRLTLEHPYSCEAEGDNTFKRAMLSHGSITSSSSKYAQPCNGSMPVYTIREFKMLSLAGKAKLSTFGILKMYPL